MNEIFTRLTNFFNLTKVTSLTAPGIIVAAGLAVLLWPLPPVDLITYPRSARGADDCTRSPMNVRQRAREELKLAGGSSLSPLVEQQVAQKTLEILEEAQIATAACLIEARRELGDDVARLESHKAQRKILEIRRDTLQRVLLSYQKANAPISDVYEDRVGALQNSVALVDERIIGVQQTERALRRNVERITEDQKLITQKLLQNGRADARNGVDEVWAALTNHMLAFSLFALLVGFILDPVSRLIGNALFEPLGANYMNNQRPNRIRVQRVQS